jgi:hypothetical protein
MASSCSVGAANGCNVTCGNALAVYARTRGLPTIYGWPIYGAYNGCTYDNDGNLCIASDYGYYSATILWLPKGDGTFYDNAPPPQLDLMGLGFRVPLILVSKYARRSFVSHTQYEFGSILKFIEQNWTCRILVEARPTSGPTASVTCSHSSASASPPSLRTLQMHATNRPSRR